MAQQIDVDELRHKSTRYLWMHNRDWITMAEEGEPMIAVEGEGVRIIDAEGRSYIDVNGGYNSVNVGYGRQEIAEAAFEQMSRISYFPLRHNDRANRFASPEARANYARLTQQGLPCFRRV